MNNKDRHIGIVWNIMLALQEDNDTEQALSSALEVLKGELNVPSACIWLLNREENKLYAAVSSGENSIAGYSISAGDGLPGEAVSQNRQIYLASTAGDARFPGGNDEVTGIKTDNVLYVPLRLPHETVGCLQLVNRTGGEAYSDEELSLCSTFCGLAAMVVSEKGFAFSSDSSRRVLLSFRNIIKEYPSGTEKLRVLKGVDLDIYENEFLVILGESGCGKSTMLNIIGGMDTMTEGTMLVDGKDFSHPDERQLTEYRRDFIGFIFQAYNLMPNLTALENIEFIAENCPQHGDPKEALALVGLTDRAGNYPSMMSGGQQQRVSIARAIVKEPKVILADEPTAALDFTTGRDVLTVIEKLVKEKHTTVVMVTHNVEIAKMADRVVRFKNGRIASIRINPWPASASELIW